MDAVFILRTRLRDPGDPLLRRESAADADIYGRGESPLVGGGGITTGRGVRPLAGRSSFTAGRCGRPLAGGSSFTAGRCGCPLPGGSSFTAGRCGRPLPGGGASTAGRVACPLAAGGGHTTGCGARPGRRGGFGGRRDHSGLGSSFGGRPELRVSEFHRVDLDHPHLRGRLLRHPWRLLHHQRYLHPLGYN